MSTYVRREKSDTWHWRDDCSNYPVRRPIIVQTIKPTTGELCNQCIAKDREEKLDYSDA